MKPISCFTEDFTGMAACARDSYTCTRLWVLASTVL